MRRTRTVNTLLDQLTGNACHFMLGGYEYRLQVSVRENGERAGWQVIGHNQILGTIYRNDLGTIVPTNIGTGYPRTRAAIEDAMRELLANRVPSYLKILSA